MEIHLSNEAIQWFQNEMDLSKGDAIQFYVRYGGSSPLQAGFSLGIQKETPFQPIVRVEIEGIHFFVEEKDLWYFDGHDLLIQIDKDSGELQFDYEKKQ